jgi:hypothetical protein
MNTLIKSFPIRLEEVNDASKYVGAQQKCSPHTAVALSALSTPMKRAPQTHRNPFHRVVVAEFRSPVLQTGF